MASEKSVWFRKLEKFSYSFVSVKQVHNPQERQERGMYLCFCDAWQLGIFGNIEIFLGLLVAEHDEVSDAGPSCWKTVNSRFGIVFFF